MRWTLLGIAIIAEVIATTTLKSTEGFTKLWPSVIVIVCYEIAFILLAFSLKKIPIGVVYAVWAGAGLSLVTLTSWIFLGQKLDAAGFVGIGLITGGVLVINLWSSTVVE